MTTVWIVDIDGTIANLKHRLHVLKKACVSCGGQFSYYTHKDSCTYCGSDVFKTTSKSWEEFQDPLLVRLDDPVKTAQAVIRKAMDHNIHVHYITAREYRTREQTQFWLEEHFGFTRDKNKLLTRDFGEDTRNFKNYQSKEQKLNQLKMLCGYTSQDSFFFMDDDKANLDMFSKYGITMLAPYCWEIMK